MTDKEKIKAKIEQLMYGFNLEADIASCEDVETEKLANIKCQVCKKILEYIDSMQEEPVSDDLENMSYHSAMEFINDPKFLPTTTFSELIPTLQKLYKDGAKWQKEQITKDVGYDLPIWRKRNDFEYPTQFCGVLITGGDTTTLPVFVADGYEIPIKDLLEKLPKEN